MSRSEGFVSSVDLDIPLSTDRPDSIAVADASGARITYAQLRDRVARLAAYLRARDIGSETVVALAIAPSANTVVALLGVLAAGAAYLPLDPADPADRLQALIQDAKARLVLTEGTTTVDGVASVSLAAAIEAAPEQSPQPASYQPDSLAYVCYTSGSTGRPKGVGVTRANLAAYLEQVLEVLDPRPGDVFSLVQPFTFDSGGTMVFPALAAGATLWVVPAERAVDAGWLAEHLAGVDYLKITPSHLAALQDAATIPLPRKALLLGGEPSRWAWFTGLAGPGRTVINHYGPTETTVGVAALIGDTAVIEPGRDTPLGPAMRNAVLHLLDDNGDPVPDGEPGEITIGGPQVSRGYLGMPGRTAAVFVPDPFSARPGARLYRTGDRGARRPDGTTEFLGRTDAQVKIRGFRVEPGEVAEVLRGHPAVTDAVVVPWRGGLAGYIRTHEPVEPDDVRAHAAATLPKYLVPDAITALDAFPLTPHGKLDTARLPEPVLPTEDTGPRSSTEEAVARLFADLLGLPQVGSNDGFFALGGHSLLVAKLLSRLRATFEVEIPARQIFEAPTVAGIAAHVDAARTRGGAQLPPVARASRTAPLPASHGQQRLWFLNQLDPTSPLYNTNLGVRALGELDTAVLRECVLDLVARHEVLRTRLVAGQDGLHQVVEPSPVVPFDHVDLSDTPERDREAELRLLIAASTERPFDLTAEVPIRVLTVRLADDEHLLLLTMHHVATEGPSMRILHRELGDLYAARVRGDLPALPEPAAQYADFAVWQRDLLARGAYARQLEFWRERLAGLPARVELRTDLARPDEISPAGDRVRFELSADLTGRLRALAAAEGATLFMILLAGFHLVLAERTAQRDVAVGIPVAFRPRPELEGTVGFFGNTLVLRTDVDRGLGFRALLRQVRAVTLDAIAHRDLPFEALVEEVRPRRRFGDTPLVNVMMMVAEEERPPVVLDEVTLQAEPIDTGTAKAELVALFEVVAGGLTGELEFRTDLFTTEGITPLAARFEQVFTEVLADPDAPIAGIVSADPTLPVPAEEVEVAVDEDYVAPRTDLEAELRALWIDLIGNPDIGVTDHFFDVGGHSLLASRVVAWIGKRYGVTVPLRWCFDSPTVADLALIVLVGQFAADDAAEDLLAQVEADR
ncbi:amino acid adenylation domain-containing protein [Actinokineospora diospyrosa]|nr:amino acid adenylation domain-containing protein [Actinokineospora diospyrosa]